MEPTLRLVGRVGAWVTVVVLALASVAAVADPVGAADVDAPYDADPLGLIAYRDLTVEMATSTDLWKVWVCDTPDGDLSIDPATVVAILERSLVEYFRWMSAGRYELQFTAGGTVQGVGERECESSMAGQSLFDFSGRAPAGALLVLDTDSLDDSLGKASQNEACITGAAVHWCHATYPDNWRTVVVGGGSVAAVEGDSSTPRLNTVAHELGHALNLPHSFGGLITEEDVFGSGDGSMWEYDNPIDVVSGAHALVGTVAVNRYANGWLDPEAVAVHDLSSEEVAQYRLEPVGGPGVEMLVVPSGQQGVFTVFSGRWRTGYDEGLPEGAEGVEAYVVDQSPDERCSGVAFTGVCWGPDRRTRTLPPSDAQDWKAAHQQWPVDYGPLMSHVHRAGDIVDGDGWRLTVEGTDADGAWVVNVGPRFGGVFRDDEGSVHEPAIDHLANQGIISGCDVSRSLFCPRDPITRARMAVWLVQALGEQPSESSSSRFSDVADDAWYGPYVERIAELGVTVGYTDGTFRPDHPVKRSQMALFLTRAFDLPDPAAGSGYFVDVDADSDAGHAIEALRLAGITKGCATSPARYCPKQPVRRDQMATFLHRALLADRS